MDWCWHSPSWFAWISPRSSSSSHAGTRVENPEAFAASAACPALTGQAVPLPVPFVIQWFKRQGEGNGEVPDTSRRLTGLLTQCTLPVAQGPPT